MESNMESRIEELLKKYSHSNRESLIPILQEIQDDIGYLPEEALRLVGKHLSVATSKIYGLATFYNQFRFQPKGENHIRMCHGTSCHIMGSSILIDFIEKRLKIKPGQTSRDGKFSLEVVSCIGACAMSPVISINGVFHSELTQDKLNGLLDEIIESD
jgi:NADH-quinone oxidoreductase E subunit